MRMKPRRHCVQCGMYLEEEDESRCKRCQKDFDELKEEYEAEQEKERILRGMYHPRRDYDEIEWGTDKITENSTEYIRKIRVDHEVRKQRRKYKKLVKRIRQIILLNFDPESPDGKYMAKALSQIQDIIWDK